jgi:cytochrome oxidase assembly protein ShyY1
MEVSDLGPIRALVEQFEKKSEKQPVKVPKIEGFEKLTEDGKLDYSDPKVKQKFIHEIFAYDRVHRGTDKGQTYEGWTEHV